MELREVSEVLSSNRICGLLGGEEERVLTEIQLGLWSP